MCLLTEGSAVHEKMAIEHLDDLAQLLIDNGIAPDLENIEPGVWVGATTRIWAHDETPQFINYHQSGQSRLTVYAGSGEDCNKVTKENRECITVQPFSNFAGDTAMCQVIFAGKGLTSHMCPEAAAEMIENLLISVNENGVTDHNTLTAAYKQLSDAITLRNVTLPVVIIADGHNSRFGEDVMSHCTKTHMDQYLLPPDTSGLTQLHDQVNHLLHARYEEMKEEFFTEYSDINKEGFMNILAAMCNEWLTTENITKAGKRVGISKDGLNISWMCQEKFI